MSIAVGEDHITLRLEPKEGKSFDLRDRCRLDYTTAHVSGADEALGSAAIAGTLTANLGKG